jgi:predicted Zn-dependent protease
MPMVHTDPAMAQDARMRLHQIDTEPQGEADTVAEIRFGEMVAARILGRTALNQDPKLNRYVSLIGTALAMHASRPDLQFHFAVLESDEVNAYSTPGGFVFVTRGAVMATENESELAAILAHEIAHISERHIVKALNIKGADKSDLSTVSRFLGASADTARAAFSQAVDKAMDVIFDTGYQIEQELDTDRVATLLLADAGYDPAALLHFLKRIDGQSSGKVSKMKTHPGSERRLNSLTQLLQEEGLSSVSYNQEIMQKRFSNHVKTTKP